jgi:anti-sigma factor RsiW
VTYDAVGPLLVRGRKEAVTDSLNVEERLIRFLLGSLPEAEHEELEERLFTDEPLQAELDATTDDLIHTYLAGGLSPEERQQFETHFLTAARHRERLAFIRELLTAVHRVEPHKVAPERVAPRPHLRAPMTWAMAASLILGAAAIVGLVRSSQDGTRQASASPSPTVAHAGTPGADATPTPAVSPRGEEAPGTSPPPADGGRVRLVRLPAHGGTAPAEIALTPATRTVRLEVKVAEGPPSYDAVIRKASGPPVWRAEDLVPARPGEPLVLTVPADLLASADYVLSVEGEALRGTESPGASRPVEYRLRVIRRSP